MGRTWDEQRLVEGRAGVRMSLVRIYREMRDDPRPQNFHGRGRPRWDERLAAKKKEEEEHRSPVTDGVAGECSVAVADEEG